MNDFKLTEEKAIDFIESIRQEVEEKTESKNVEVKSLFKDDFQGLELKIKDLEMKLEMKIEKTKNETLRWLVGGLMACFIPLAIMILGLYFQIK